MSRRWALLAGAALASTVVVALAPRARAAGERALLGQAGGPHGPLAGLTAALLNRVTGSVNRAALEAVAPRGGERLLDVGFGGGGLIEYSLDTWPELHVAGADPSRAMVERLGARRAAEIAEGRLRVVEAGVDTICWPDGSFDCVTAVFTMYFWPDPLAGLRRVADLLAPGGRLAVAVAPLAAQTSLGYERAGFNVLPGPRVLALAETAGLVGATLTRGPHGVALVTARARAADHPSP